MNLSTDLATPLSALAIVAHPDDAEFQCGATLAKWSAAGTTVHHLVLTDGSKGTWDPDADRPALVRVRQEEQRAAAAELGATGEVLFLEREDGELVADHAGRGEVAAVLRRLRPAVVLAHDPWRRYRLHPDHHAAGRLAVDGIVAARDPFFHREQLAAGLEVHRPDALLLFEPDEVNHLEVVDDTHLASQLRALEAHRSQLATTHLYRRGSVDDAEAIEEFRTSRRRVLTDAAVGTPHAMAEAFHLIVDQL